MGAIQSPFGGSGGNFGGVFGDGSSGAVVMDGVNTFPGFATLVGSLYTLTTDVFATSLTINAGVTLNTADFRVFCTGTVTNNGTMTMGPAGNAAGAAGGTAWTTHGFFEAPIAGATGTTIAGTQTAQSDWGAIGTGASGAGGSGTSGAGGGQNSPIFGTNGFPAVQRMPNPYINNMTWGSHGAFQPAGGSGGSSGAGDGVNSGGGGGAGGGIMAIFAYALVNTGTISVAGGNGGTPPAGNCGGGGGGAGGVFVAYTLAAWTNTGTITAAGGSPGAGVGTGTTGVAGTVGTTQNTILK